MSSQFEFYTGKKCLVTGGPAMGKEVANLLLEAGSQVKVVSLDKININNIEHVYAILQTFPFVLNRPRIDCVFHLAGIKGSIEVLRLSQQVSWSLY